ncbi:MAG: CaiB/BaiF CoA-transferase family protein [Myxococcales bacterium]|nr:CaiB/BaiF CoA-transferase family protein [Myxococcales bacterium]
MGPLKGIKIIEVAGIGPGPFAAMMLSDMGAEVLRLDRIPKRTQEGPSLDLLNRGRPSAGIDLKHPDGVGAALELIGEADALIEGFRPGVMERLGLGPVVCLARNPKLVYGRMTGWGQDGPLASAAGHDINYIALSGALHAIGRAGENPVPPLNLVGDFGGGGMLLAYGVVCALLETQRSGEGQVVDAAMIDGASILMTMFHSMGAMGFHKPERGVNMLDTGAHFYETYETSDGQHVAVGAIEPQFYAELLERTGLAGEALPRQMDRSQWPEMKKKLAALFKQKTRAQWCELLEGSDACFAPVLSLAEAAEHPHNVQRSGFIELAGVRQPAPAPRFSRTAPKVARPPSQPGADTDEALTAWGLSSQRIAALREAGAVG